MVPSVEVVVLSRRAEADGVVSLELGPATADPLPPWTPGAHIDLCLPGGLIRQYSLCGTSGAGGTWRVAVLREPQGRGGSAWVHDNVTEGTRLKVLGPRNHFELLPARQYVFIAGGIGITPILPMIARASRTGARWLLWYGGRTRRSMAFLDELERYGDRVRLRPQQECGPLDLTAMLGEVEPGTLVYCCGPAGLLDAVRERCRALPPGTLHIERFILQRHLGEWVAASFVVAEAGLVLSSALPVRPGPDLPGFGRVAMHQVDQQATDLR